MSGASVLGRLNRRALLGSSALLGAGLSGLGAVAAADDRSPGSAALGASVRQAVSFLQRAVDAHHPSGPRLAQSYQDDSGLTDHAFIYDNALAVIALLSGGDLPRARAIGDALVYAQEHDADAGTAGFKPGRLRETYHADRFTDSNGTAISGYDFNLAGTAVGNMAWCGIALADLYRRTRATSYRTAATRIAQWIYDNTYSTSGLGGYTFGPTGDLQNHKSAEHNIDVYPCFRMMAGLTGDPVWHSRADHGLAFVRALWNNEAGCFWTGSDDGSTVNTKATQRPLDVQTWSWLAAPRAQYAGALDWAKTNLATTDTPLRTNSALSGNYSVTGVAFASGSLLADTEAPIDAHHGNPDSGAVWFEGTSQLALALADRGARGDRADAGRLLGAVRSAQAELGRGQRFGGQEVSGGIVAASSPMHTGYGFGYYPDLHVGATSWYILAATGTNPYRLP